MIKRKSRYYLEKSLRRFIREGVNTCLHNDDEDETQEFLLSSNVIMANDSVRSPDGLFATLQYVGESRSSPYFYQKGEELWVQQAIHAKYLVCFLRSFDSWDGVSADQRTGERAIYTSYDAAQAFIDFVESYRGMGWASNAVVDGRLKKVYVYQTSDEEEKPASAKVNPTEFNNEEIDIPVPVSRKAIGVDENNALIYQDDGHEAKIRLYASSNGKIESGFIVDYGSGYFKGQGVSIAPYIDGKKISGENWPTVTAVGGGFTVDNQLMIEEDDYPRDDQTVERRCMIEMDISFLEDRKEKDVKTVSRYELNIDWKQGMWVVPLQLKLVQGDPNGKDLAFSLHQQPASKIKVFFDAGDDFNIQNGLDEVIDSDSKRPYIIITPEDWKTPHSVKVSAKPSATSERLRIKTESIGRSEDNITLDVSISYHTP